MPEEPKQAGDDRKAVGVYDRPRSADFPRRAVWMIAIVAVLAFLAYLFLR